MPTPHPVEPDSPWLTTHEVAAWLRKDLGYVYGELRSGRLRAARIGKSWRVLPADLEAFVAARSNAATPATPAEPVPGVVLRRSRGRRERAS